MQHTLLETVSLFLFVSRLQDPANSNGTSNNFSFSLPPDQLAKYPAWLIVFLCQIILPMIGVVIIAIKITMISGKHMRRELLGSTFQSTIVPIV